MNVRKKNRVTRELINGNFIRQVSADIFSLGRVTQIKNSVINQQQAMQDYDRLIEGLTYKQNGNISQQNFTYSNIPNYTTYTLLHYYSPNNRLSSVTYAGDSNYTQIYHYDADGNFTYKREGPSRFNYVYKPNTNILDTLISGSNRYSYTYDSEGRLNSDRLRGNVSIAYGYQNLPIKYFDMYGNDSYNYYDESGSRIGKKIYEGPNEYYLRDNTGRELAVYDKNTDRLKYFNLFGNGSLGRVEVTWDSVWVEDPNHESSGYWSYSRTDSRYYYIKDHLGSIRITIDETGNVVNAQDYYSFGSILRSYNSGGLNGERYKFTGKERDTETSYDYFGARYYDSNLGRWLTPDPLADKYPGWSPYNYVMNNPLRNIDPDGKAIKDKNTGQYINGTTASLLLTRELSKTLDGNTTAKLPIMGSLGSFRDQWEDFKDYINGSTYEHHRMYNTSAIGKEINGIKLKNGAELRSSRQWAVKLGENDQEITLQSFSQIGNLKDGKAIFELTFGNESTTVASVKLTLEQLKEFAKAGGYIVNIDDSSNISISKEEDKKEEVNK